MSLKKNKIQKKESRHKRIRAKIKGIAEIPRLSVYRSNKYIYLSATDDELGKTILSVSDIKSKDNKKTKSEKAKILGKEMGEKLKSKNIKKIIFDRGGYKYHGRVKSAADGIRESGLEF